jgi:hypothetical protein
MSQLTIARGSAWGDKLRPYRVFVDGKSVGEIRESSEITVPVTTGKHTVQLRIDWCASPELQIAVSHDSNEFISCGPRFNPLFAPLAVSLFRKKYLWAKHVPAGA